MSFTLQGINPFYEDMSLQVRFFSNLSDGPDAYDIFLGESGEHHFYLPAHVLPELSSPTTTEREMLSKLECLNPVIPEILREHRISGEAFRASLQQVALKQEERYPAFLRENAVEHHQS